MKKMRLIALSVMMILALPFSALADLTLPPGTGLTNVVVQNVSTAAANVTVQYYDTTGQLDYTQSGVSIPASAVQELKTQDLPAASIPDGWQGSAVLSADQQVSAVVSNRISSTGREDGRTQDAYVGGMAGANALYLPDLKRVPLTADPTQANQVSKIYVQNTEGTQATIYMNYFNRQGGAEGVLQSTIPAYSQKSFDLRIDSQVPAGVADGFGTTNDGACYITSTNRIYAIVQTTFQNWDAAYESSATTSDVLYAPAAYRTMRSDGTWNIYSAVIVQNPSTSATIDVNINYINRTTGATDLRVTRTLAPLSATGLNTRTGGDLPADTFNGLIGEGTTELPNWSGSVLITSTAQMVGSANIMWFAATQNYAGAYVLKGPAEAGATIYASAYYRRNVGGSWGAGSQWSAFILQNTENVARTVTVNFISPTGGISLTRSINLGPGAGLGLNSRTGGPEISSADFATALGDGFIGGVYATAPAGSRIIAVTNIVYSDRSSVYNNFIK